MSFKYGVLTQVFPKVIGNPCYSYYVRIFQLSRQALNFIKMNSNMKTAVNHTWNMTAA